MFFVAAGGYGAYTSAVLDPLIAGLAYQATCQIKILKNNLQFLSEHVKDEVAINANFDKASENTLMYDKIRKCVIHHNLILE